MNEPAFYPSGLRIMLFTLMRIRALFLASTHPLWAFTALHGSIFEPLKLLSFDFNADLDPDQAFVSNVDSDPASKTLRIPGSVTLLIISRHLSPLSMYTAILVKRVGGDVIIYLSTEHGVRSYNVRTDHYSRVISSLHQGSTSEKRYQLAFRNWAVLFTCFQDTRARSAVSNGKFVLRIFYPDTHVFLFIQIWVQFKIQFKYGSANPKLGLDPGPDLGLVCSGVVDPDPAFWVKADPAPDPGVLMIKNCSILQLKKITFSLIKNCDIFLGLHEGHPSFW